MQSSSSSHRFRKPLPTPKNLSASSYFHIEPLQRARIVHRGEPESWALRKIQFDERRRARHFQSVGRRSGTMEPGIF